MVAYLVHQFLETAAKDAPEHPFVVEQSGRHTYGEMDAGANRLAHLLRRVGVSKGARVGILVQNSALYVQAYYGTLKAGAVTVPLNTAADPRSLTHFLADCEVEALLAGPRTERLVSGAASGLGDLKAVIAANPERIQDLPSSVQLVPLAEVDNESTGKPEETAIDDDVASIIYTSGSTGRPRGATLTHLNLVSNTRSIVEYLRLCQDDRVLVVLPFYYVYGKSLLNTHAAAGGTVVLENRFLYPNVVLDTLEKERCTGFAGVPSTFAILLNRSNLASRELADLRYLTQAGGAMSPALTRRLLEALPKQQLVIMYGATEAGARLSYLPAEDLPEAVGSIGQAIPNVELRVLRADGNEADVDEVGELVARGSNIMRGYWGAAEETAKVLDGNGYHTGDLARRDERGMLYIVGRSKDMIKAGAHRIAAKEIEEAILEHDAIHETAVIGIPDEILGEQIKALIVLREGAELSADELGKFLRGVLPAYKLPGVVEFRDDLPKNESGKIMKQVLRAEPQDGPQAQSGKDAPA